MKQFSVFFCIIILTSFVGALHGMDEKTELQTFNEVNNYLNQIYTKINSDEYPFINLLVNNAEDLHKCQVTEKFLDEFIDINKKKGFSESYCPGLLLTFVIRYRIDPSMFYSVLINEIFAYKKINENEKRAMIINLMNGWFDKSCYSQETLKEIVSSLLSNESKQKRKKLDDKIVEKNDILFFERLFQLIAGEIDLFNLLDKEVNEFVKFAKNEGFHALFNKLHNYSVINIKAVDSNENLIFSHIIHNNDLNVEEKAELFSFFLKGNLMCLFGYHNNVFDVDGNKTLRPFDVVFDYIWSMPNEKAKLFSKDFFNIIKEKLYPVRENFSDNGQVIFIWLPLLYTLQSLIEGRLALKKDTTLLASMQEVVNTFLPKKSKQVIKETCWIYKDIAEKLQFFLEYAFLNKNEEIIKYISEVFKVPFNIAYKADEKGKKISLSDVIEKKLEIMSIEQLAFILDMIEKYGGKDKECFTCLSKIKDLKDGIYKDCMIQDLKSLIGNEFFTDDKKKKSIQDLLNKKNTTIIEICASVDKNILFESLIDANSTKLYDFFVNDLGFPITTYFDKFFTQALKRKKTKFFDHMLSSCVDKNMQVSEEQFKKFFAEFIPLTKDEPAKINVQRLSQMIMIAPCYCLNMEKYETRIVKMLLIAVENSNCKNKYAWYAGIIDQLDDKTILALLKAKDSSYGKALPYLEAAKNKVKIEIINKVSKELEFALNNNKLHDVLFNLFVECKSDKLIQQYILNSIEKKHLEAKGLNVVAQILQTTLLSTSDKLALLNVILSDEKYNNLLLNTQNEHAPLVIAIKKRDTDMLHIIEKHSYLSLKEYNISRFLDHDDVLFWLENTTKEQQIIIDQLDDLLYVQLYKTQYQDLVFTERLMRLNPTEELFAAVLTCRNDKLLKVFVENYSFSKNNALQGAHASILWHFLPEDNSFEDMMWLLYQLEELSPETFGYLLKKCAPLLQLALINKESYEHIHYIFIKSIDYGFLSNFLEVLSDEAVIILFNKYFLLKTSEQKIAYDFDSQDYRYTLESFYWRLGKNKSYTYLFAEVFLIRYLMDVYCESFDLKMPLILDYALVKKRIDIIKEICRFTSIYINECTFDMPKIKKTDFSSIWLYLQQCSVEKIIRFIDILENDEEIKKSFTRTNDIVEYVVRWYKNPDELLKKIQNDNINVPCALRILKIMKNSKIFKTYTSAFECFLNRKEDKHFGPKAVLLRQLAKKEYTTNPFM